MEHLALRSQSRDVSLPLDPFDPWGVVDEQLTGLSPQGSGNIPDGWRNFNGIELRYMNIVALELVAALRRIK